MAGQISRRAIRPASSPLRPHDGAKEVDPATAEVTVTFDRDMASGFTWNGDGPDFPFLAGAKAFWRDRRTCVLPVKLEPGRSYRVGLNLFSPNFQAFRSVAGGRALPTTINFTTGAREKPDGNAEASNTDLSRRRRLLVPRPLRKASAGKAFASALPVRS